MNLNLKLDLNLNDSDAAKSIALVYLDNGSGQACVRATDPESA